MNPEEYDSYQALVTGIRSLENFKKLIKERFLAGYKRGETLKKWIIFGRFHLDSAGNTTKFVPNEIPAILFPHIPPILTSDEFDLFIKKNSEKYISFGAGLNNNIPEARLLCPDSLHGWTIHNCHDTVVTHEELLVRLDAFAGQKISAVKQVWDAKIDQVWKIQSDDPLNIDERIIQLGDEVLVNTWTYRHTQCCRSNKSKQ